MDFGQAPLVPGCGWIPVKLLGFPEFAAGERLAVEGGVLEERGDGASGSRR